MRMNRTSCRVRVRRTASGSKPTSSVTGSPPAPSECFRLVPLQNRPPASLARSQSESFTDERPVHAFAGPDDRSELQAAEAKEALEGVRARYGRSSAGGRRLGVRALVD